MGRNRKYEVVITDVAGNLVHELTCRDCGKTKPASEFYLTAMTYCRDCHRARVMGARPPREILPEGMRRCARCKEIKLDGEFYNRVSYCRPCQKAYANERYRVKMEQKRIP